MPEVRISAIEELRKGGSLPLLSGFLQGAQEAQLKTEASADGSRSEAPMIPSSGLSNLLQQLTKLREISHCCQSGMRRQNRRTVRHKRCTGEGAWERKRSFQGPSGDASLCSERSPTQKLSQPCPFGFLLGLLYAITFNSSPW